MAANVIPDHATIARFVVRHEAALVELFGEVLGLCAKAGLVKPEVVAIDGTRLAANATPESNRDYGQIAREILAEARAVDEAEDELYGEARGDELPEQLQTSEGLRAFFVEARRAGEQHDADVDWAQKEIDDEAGSGYEFDVERIVARVQGREGWLRDAERQLDRRRWRDAEPVPRSRAARLEISAGRLGQDLEAERAGNEAYQAYRAQGG